MRTLKYFLEYSGNHKARLYQLDIIREFLQEKVNIRVFVNMDSKYADYFPEYSNYFGRSLILLKSIYVITNSGKLFAYELTGWLL